MDNNSVISQIGNTINQIKTNSELTGCNIYGKAEYYNPGGPLKIERHFLLFRMH